MQRERKKGLAPALHILCNCDEALNDARVLQTETAMAVGHLVSVEGGKGVLGYEYGVEDASAVAVLLTKEVLHDVQCLIALYQACVQASGVERVQRRNPHGCDT